MPTQKYLMLHKSTPGGGGSKGEMPSPAQMQEMYAAFNAWKEKYKANLVDLGGKLKPQGKTVSASSVTDGPMVEVKEIIGGYMIVAAESYEHAIEVARACPGILAMPGSSIEIREIQSTP